MQPNETVSKSKSDVTPTPTPPNISMVAAGPQYGVAIIPAATLAEAITPATVTISDDIETKDLHSIPNKAERFKVVKIASAEPFRRGRWKCMDYVDHTPPVTTQHSKSTTQGPTAVQIGGNMYFQTQSLPPQQIQQLLMQSGFTTGPSQFIQGSTPSQILPQAQYFYPAVQNPQQILNASVVSGNSVQPQFISTNSQPFLQPGIVTTAATLHNFQNLQLLQQAYQNQGSAFAPTTQNFQQGQTYAGQTSYSETQNQQSIPTTQGQTQPILNGYTYPQQNVSEQQVTTSSIPTQPAKNIILNNSAGSDQASHSPAAASTAQVIANEDKNSVNQSAPAQNSQPSDQNPTYHISQVPQNIIMQAVNQVIPPNGLMSSQGQSLPSEPQVIATIQAIPVGDISGVTDGNSETATGIEGGAEGGEDPAKANPVVNAIDNKIEQAMDLVKSHLMYTVREEVEILKEKIAELMERIQQLESENAFLRSQIPKTAGDQSSGGTSDSTPQQ